MGHRNGQRRRKKGQRKKRRPVLWMTLILSVILLAVLIVMLASMMIHEQQTGMLRPDQETEEEETGQSQTEEQQTQEESTVDELWGEEDQKRSGFIIIGDSHTVVADGQGYRVHGSAVEDVVLDENLFLVHTSLDPVMGTIEWLEGDGTDRMKGIIAEHPDIAQWNIICMHGTSMVPFPDIAERYIADYQEWIDGTFADCNVHIVSVPPLDEEEWVVRHPDMPARYNQDIIRFNKELAQAFPDQFLDYYDWLAEREAFQDEIHYTGETYLEMFDEIILQITQDAAGDVR